MSIRILNALNFVKCQANCSALLLQFQRQYGSCNYSTAAGLQRIAAPRTAANSPTLHTQDQLGLWYTVDPDIANRLFGTSSFCKKLLGMNKTFQETSFMVREPALAVMDYIKRSNLSLPPNKFLFYGENGTGKTISLAHVLHFLSEEKWLLVHVPWAPQWRRQFKEVTPSLTVPGSFDHPVDAANWLQHFRNQNGELIKELNLVTAENYVWSRREQMEVGAPLMSLVDHGINRTRYASEVLLALTAELKKHATEGRCKLALAVDGINSFFSKVSRHKENHVFVDPKRFTIYHAFTHLLKNDWKNGCVVGTIDKRANESDRRESHLPRYLLRKSGWETLDPFIPVQVVNYNDLEMVSIFNYYMEHEWLQNTGEDIQKARDEITAYTNRNPQAIMEFSFAI